MAAAPTPAPLETPPSLPEVTPTPPSPGEPVM
jgi:hypothetical protein